jgi:hypothetical protein
MYGTIGSEMWLVKAWNLGDDLKFMRDQEVVAYNDLNLP